MLFKKTLPSLLLMLSASCATGASPTDCPPDFCKYAQPMYYSEGEVFSDKNARKVNAMRDAGQEFCGWKKPN